MNTKPMITTGTVCNPELFQFPAVKKRTVTASFSGGDVTRDGGLPLLRLLARRLGPTQAIAQPQGRPPCVGGFETAGAAVAAGLAAGENPLPGRRGLLPLAAAALV